MDPGERTDKRYGLVVSKLMLVKKCIRLGHDDSKISNTSGVGINVVRKIMEDMRRESGGTIKPLTKRQRGGGRRSKAPPATLDIVSKAIEMRRQGKGLKQIGRALGYSPSAISVWTKRIAGERLVAARAVVNPEPEAQTTPVQINFCPHCGHRIPNAVIGSNI